MIAPTGEQYEITAGAYRAVVTQGGATLRVLQYDGRDLVAGFGEDEKPSSGSGQLLMPWPNRIRDGRYSHDGTTYQLPLTEPDKHNASHGLVRWAAWTPLSRGGDAITLGHRLMAQTGYPWTLDLEVTYALSEDGLKVTQRATNRAAGTAPYAAGAHPYLTFPDRRVDDWVLELPGSVTLSTDERLLPSGIAEVASTELDFRVARAIGSIQLDTCFGDLARGSDGHVRVGVTSGEHRTVLWADESVRWLMAFTGDTTAHPRTALAVEPMTAPVDAFNSGEDLTVLQPGESHSTTWGIQALS